MPFNDIFGMLPAEVLSKYKILYIYNAKPNNLAV